MSRASDEPVAGPRDTKSPTSRGYAIQTVHSLSRYVGMLLCDEAAVRKELDLIDRYKHWLVLGYETKAEMLRAEVIAGLGRQSVPEEVLQTTTRRLFAAASSEAAAAVDAVEEPAAGSRPRVLNLRHHGLGDAVYVGRASPRRGLAGSAFGNPYLVGRDGTREQVIELYRQWLLDQPALLDRLHELRGRRLACWCSPEPCHADVLAELVDADALLDELKAAGVRVEARGDRLALLPASAVDEALVARVRPHKPAILALLASRQPLPDATETWLAAVEQMAAEHDVPPAVLAELKAARVNWR